MGEIRITRIKETRRGRFALFSQDEFLLSVDGETLAKSGLEEGSSITDGELSLLKEGSDTRRAKDQALRYLSLRAYGEQELYAKLCLKYDEHSAAAAVATMRELALLDDELFAQEKAKGLAMRGKSSAEIRRKLVSLGLERQLINRALQAAAPDDTATAVAILHKSYAEKLRQGDVQKVKAVLARKGFSHAVICRAIEAVQQEIGAQTQGCGDERE